MLCIFFKKLELYSISNISLSCQEICQQAGKQIPLFHNSARLLLFIFTESFNIIIFYTTIIYWNNMFIFISFCCSRVAKTPN